MTAEDEQHEGAMSYPEAETDMSSRLRTAHTRISDLQQQLITLQSRHQQQLQIWTEQTQHLQHVKHAES